MPRRRLVLIAVLAAILHGIGIARSSLPAQDGLKFLRVARQFHEKPWADVVRGSDHPALRSWKGTPNLSLLFGAGILGAS